MRSPAPNRRASQDGFTLIELLVVMAIVTVLAGSLVVVMPKLRTRAMNNAARSDITHLSLALDMYKEDIGAYPSAPYISSQAGYEPDPIDGVLFRALTDRNADSPTSDEQRSLADVRGKVVILYFLDYT